MRDTLPVTPIDRLDVRAPVAARVTDLVRDVVARMRGADQGAVLVEDDRGALIGILTEHDLVRAAATEPEPTWIERSIERWVRPAPSTLRCDDSIATAIHAMQEGRFRRLPVVDGDGRAVGIVSIRDVLAWVADAFPEEFANLPPDPAHEASGPWGG